MIYTGHNLNLIFAEIPFFDQKPAIFEQKVTDIPDIPFHFGFYMQCMDYFQKILQKKIWTMIMILTRKEFMPTEVERNSKT